MFLIYISSISELSWLFPSAELWDSTVVMKSFFLTLYMLTFVNKNFSHLQVQIYELEEHKIETWRGKHYWVLKIF